MYEENNMIFGREGDFLFVNSADAISRDRVDELFPNACANGSVLLEEIHAEIGPGNGQIRIGDLVVGRVANRRYIESAGQEVRGKPYTKRQANNLINGADFIGQLQGSDGGAIDYSSCSSLYSYVEQHHLKV